MIHQTTLFILCFALLLCICTKAYDVAKAERSLKEECENNTQKTLQSEFLYTNGRCYYFGTDTDLTTWTNTRDICRDMKKRKICRFKKYQLRSFNDGDLITIKNQWELPGLIRKLKKPDNPEDVHRRFWINARDPERKPKPGPGKLDPSVFKWEIDGSPMNEVYFKLWMHFPHSSHCVAIFPSKEDYSKLEFEANHCGTGLYPACEMYPKGCDLLPFNLPDGVELVDNNQNTTFDHGAQLETKCRQGHARSEAQSDTRVMCSGGTWKHDIQPCLPPCHSLPNDLPYRVQVSSAKKAPFANGTQLEAKCHDEYVWSNPETDKMVLCVDGKWKHNMTKFPCTSDPTACEYAGVWNEWSPCTNSCGKGTRSRMRKRPIPSGCSHHENVECETAGEWKGWSECSSTCGEGQRARTRNVYTNSTDECQMAELGPCTEEDCN